MDCKSIGSNKSCLITNPKNPSQHHYFINQVVCHKCSGQKYPLQFEESKVSRVCRACFHLLNLHAEKEAQRKPDQPDPSGSDQPDPAILSGRDSMDAPVRPKGLLEVIIRHQRCKLDRLISVTKKFDIDGTIQL